MPPRSNEHVGSERLLGEHHVVDPHGQRDPEVEPAGRHGQGLRAHTVAHGRRQSVATFPQGLADLAQVARPRWRGDEFQCGFLQWAGDEEVLDQADCP